MAWSTKNKDQSGFTLIEALLAISILMAISVGGISANRLATTSVLINQQRSQANLWVRSATEALMSVRAGAFSSLTAGDFHPVFDGVNWTLVPGSETVGGFTRTITLSPVFRDLVCPNPVCDIVTNGGVSDEGSYMAKIKVSWFQAGEMKETSVTTLVTYWR